MLACAELVVVAREGRSVVTTLRAQSPLALVPRRGVTAASRSDAVVHLVGSASTPLAGDDVTLTVTVGAGAHLTLTGVAAAVALPGGRSADRAARPSRTVLRCSVGDGGSLTYLPEPTVVTGRAHHETVLDVVLAPTAALRARDLLVAGRTGERPGRCRGTVRVTECSAAGNGPAPGRPLLVQTQEIGDPLLDASPAHLAGHRVLGTEVLVGPAREQVPATCGDGWSLSPLPGRGALATAVAHDAVTAARRLAEAVRAAS
ncbi:urease accessory protein UreD [Pseudonocardia sp. DR1-2]|uniref:urease accessory protein UreD n=1 Tax=Pseudonocardia sp. DR1-2 TaxID=2951168 RepID=UPI002042C6A2|nr:urease accessory protein UreD [Pseudonocardia sp. DR1-2]MCM3845271.1 urease accessory protein UreD [Pseudonocardia sp. DR1-2]